MLLSIITSGAFHASQPRFWRIDSQGVHSDGVTSISGADGVTMAEQKGNGTCLTLNPASNSQYLYFQIHTKLSAGNSPLYVSVEYFDNGPYGAVQLQYDSSAGEAPIDLYRPADDSAGGWRSGTEKDEEAIFELEKPFFHHRENLGSDFRLQGIRLCIRSIHVLTTQPEEWKALSHYHAPLLPQLAHIGSGSQLIIGGFDPAHVYDAGPQTHALESALPELKAMGVTSQEVYVRWNLCEPAKGHYDWSVYDRYAALYKRYHIKWVPFLICGSAYSLPDWYYKHPGYQGYVCLEHHEESDVQSLWNPAFREHVAHFIKAFCLHYRNSGVIEAILLGISGNYGEAIYPVSGMDWTADIHGPYHSHPGFWAGDPYAILSFRNAMKKKYVSLKAISSEWKKTYSSWNQIQPFLQKDAPDVQAWLDFMRWYTDSMTEWAGFWMKTTRQYFPGDIYLCTGGDSQPEYGSNFGDQCKEAARYHAGVRITNEGSDYPYNFALTRWVASAGKQYGAYCSFEPASNVTPSGVVARIYNAASSGALGLHYYYDNLFGKQKARENFIKYAHYFQQNHPIVQIAVYYPQTYIWIHGNHFLSHLIPLRNQFDFDYQSDDQIADGGLKRYKALLLLDGNIMPMETARIILHWVQQGGILLSSKSMGVLQNPEGGDAPDKELFGTNVDTGRGKSVRYTGDGGRNGEYAFFINQLMSSASLSTGTKTMLTEEEKEPGIYAALISPHSILWYNSLDEAEVMPDGKSMAPNSIMSQRLP